MAMQICMLITCFLAVYGMPVGSQYFRISIRLEDNEDSSKLNNLKYTGKMYSKIVTGTSKKNLTEVTNISPY